MKTDEELLEIVTLILFISLSEFLDLAPGVQTKLYPGINSLMN